MPPIIPYDNARLVTLETLGVAHCVFSNTAPRRGGCVEPVYVTWRLAQWHPILDGTIISTPCTIRASADSSIPGSAGLAASTHPGFITRFRKHVF